MKTPSQFLEASISGAGSIAVEYYFSKETETQPGVVDLHCTFHDESRSTTISLKEPVSRKAVKDQPVAEKVIGAIVSEYFSGTAASSSNLPTV